jgi:hypothetical protein
LIRQYSFINIFILLYSNSSTLLSTVGLIYKQFHLHYSQIISLPLFGTAQVETADEFSQEFGVVSVIHLSLSVYRQQTLQEVQLGTA